MSVLWKYSYLFSVFQLALALVLLSSAAQAAQPQVSAGFYFSTMIKEDGTLWAWGRNNLGQLGNGNNLSQRSPKQLGSDTDWKYVSSGYSHVLALKNDGSLWAWGSNNYGQLGNGTTAIMSPTPIQVGSETDWATISAGNNHSLAIKSDGTLWAWGANQYNQLGNGTTINKASPIQIGTSNNWKSIAATDGRSFAIRTDGSLWSWGNNWYGQLGNGTTIASSTPAQVGSDADWAMVSASQYHTTAIKESGTLWAWGHNAKGQLGLGNVTSQKSPKRVGLENDWRYVDAGWGHTVALKNTNTLWVWGSGELGELGLDSNNTMHIPTQLTTDATWNSASAGMSHTLALKSDGTAWSWGQNSDGELGNAISTHQKTPLLLDAPADTQDEWNTFASGDRHTIALKKDGTLWSWGFNEYGQLGRGTAGKTYETPGQIGTDTDWVTIATGNHFSLALKTDGSLWAWGSNQIRQLGDGTLINRHTPVRIGSANDWKMIAAGHNHTLALKTNGTLWAWGYDQWGQLGDGTTNSTTAGKVQVGHDRDWEKISASDSHNIAIKSDGSLWAWGYNNYYQLGDGTKNHQHSPIQVGTDTDWTAADAGSRHILALKSDGSLWSWGSSSWGELGDGTKNPRPTPLQVGTENSWRNVQAGTFFSAALKSDNTFWAWGENAYGQHANGSTNTSVLTPTQTLTDSDWASIMVGNGSRHTFALKTDGSLWGWGSNSYRQLGNGDPLHPTQIRFNNMPIITSPPPVSSIVVGGQYTHTFSASDIDNDTLMFSAPTLPTWLTFNRITGVLNGTPTANTLGANFVRFRVSDGQSEVDQTFFIDVAHADFDQDGEPDITDNDDDNDGIPDTYETAHGLDPFNSLDAKDDLDGDGVSNLDEYNNQSDITKDDYPPEVTAPTNIVTDATGALTSINLGTATAIDTDGTQLTATPDKTGPFPPGRNTIVWTATDAAGNKGNAMQIVDVHPLASFTANQALLEGSTALVHVQLNGEAPSYPVIIPFTVGGTASYPADHALAQGEIIINSGKQGQASFPTFHDALVEQNEYIEIVMGNPTNATIGTPYTHIVSLLENNVAPTVSLSVTQGNNTTSTVNSNSIPVIVTTTVTDINPEDTHTFDWSGSNSTLIDIDNHPDTFTIDASTLNNGVYTVSVTITDNGSPALSTTASAQIQVENTFATITSIPSLHAEVETPYSYTLAAIDADGDQLIFDAPLLPTWLSFDPSNGLLTGTPPTGTEGNHGVQLLVSDGKNEVQQNFIINVIANDTDDDGQPDIIDLDDDNDGLPDDYETNNNLDPLNPDDASQDLDGDGISNLAEFQQNTDIAMDDNPPIVIAPGNIEMDATGLFTDVVLGTASAIDSLSGELNAVPDQTGPFLPGRHVITWSAVDAAGNTGNNEQIVDIRPIANFAHRQTTGEGAQIRITAQLNGPAPRYPVTIPFTVAGTALHPDDHNLTDGEIIITEGTEGYQLINIVQDDIIEADEQIVITMGIPTNATKGKHDQHQVTIIERNIAPRASLNVVQHGNSTSLVIVNKANVVITSAVVDPNPNDTHQYDWSFTDNVLIDADNESNTFTVDPSTLSSGIYAISVKVTDSGSPAYSTVVSTHIKVINNAPVLTSENDSDGDGINDANEGYGDSDGDRVPDYLDATDTRNVIQSTKGESNKFLMEAKPGLSLRIGEIAMSAETHGGQVSAEHIKQKSKHHDAEDAQASVVGGYFDFEVDGLSDIGQSVEIVIPQRSAIPEGAVYRKLMPTVGWQDFVQNANNLLHSAPGSKGYCPPPNDDEYTEGLTTGHWCVQLTIEDGGPNDADGIANGAIVDPGGVSVMRSTSGSNTTTSSPSTAISLPSNNGGGAGSLGYGYLLLIYLFARRARPKRKYY